MTAMVATPLPWERWKEDPARQPDLCAYSIAPDYSLEELRRIHHPAIVEQMLDGWRKGGDPALRRER
jgi:hypothetical protein